MIGAAHTSTVAEIRAAARRQFSADGTDQAGWTDTPILTIESAFADPRETLLQWRDRAGEDTDHA